MKNEFFRKVLRIGLPMVIEQLLITSFGIIDTIMVKYIPRGISGVGLASQISQVTGTVMFAFAVGVGMFIAQFYGDKDIKSIKKSFSLLLILATILSFIFTTIAVLIPKELLSIFTDDQEVLEVGVKYIRIAAFSYIPNMLSYAFSIAYRNIQKTTVPLVIQLSSAVVNVILNYLLIFGIWIFPELGIVGAALATVISCILSLVTNIIYMFVSKQIFTPKLSSFKDCLDKKFVGSVMRKAFPLLINESLFSIGQMLYVVIFNRFGTDSYEGYRITESVISILSSITYGVSTVVASMTGELLGAREFDKAKKYGNSFIKYGVLLAIIMGALVIVLARPLVGIFSGGEVTDTSIDIAYNLMFVSALRIALRLFITILFSIFRAGGKSKFVLVMDCGVLWVVGLPIAFIGYRFLKIDDISILLLLMQSEAIVRIIIGLKEYFRYSWERNIIENLCDKSN